MKSATLIAFACVASAALLLCCGCASRATTSVPATKEAAAAAPQSTPTPELSDPTCCGLASFNSEGVAQAWQQFTKDGRYRLASDKDMRYPDAADAKWGNEWRIRPHTFVYAWGHRNFDTEHDHLAVIVVDTTREGPDNFGLVMFSSPTGSKGYQPYWVFQGRDLSRTRVNTTSGYLTVREVSGDATSFNTCDIFWNDRRRRYVCVPLKN